MIPNEVVDKINEAANDILSRFPQKQEFRVFVIAESQFQETVKKLPDWNYRKCQYTGLISCFPPNYFMRTLRKISSCEKAIGLTEADYTASAAFRIGHSLPCNQPV